MNKGEKVLGVIGMIMFVAIVIGVIAMKASSCDGTLVRGLIWLECIEGSNDE